MALIKCSECGKDVSDKASSCPNCGNPIIVPKKDRVCEKCGGLVSDTAETCVHCGAELDKSTITNRKTNICAVLGFLFGVVSVFINPYALFGIAAIIISCVGSVQINNNHEKGSGYSILGFLLGLISVGYFIYQVTQYQEVIVTFLP